MNRKMNFFVSQEELYAIYDAMMTAEASGDYATASRLSKKIYG